MMTAGTAMQFYGAGLFQTLREGKERSSENAADECQVKIHPYTGALMVAGTNSPPAKGEPAAPQRLLTVNAAPGEVTGKAAIKFPPGGTIGWTILVQKRALRYAQDGNAIPDAWPVTPDGIPRGTPVADYAAAHKPLPWSGALPPALSGTTTPDPRRAVTDWP